MDTPPPPPPPPAPPAAPAPAPAPAAATLALGTERDRVVLAGRSLRVAGRLTPAVKGERVVVRLYAGKRKVAAKDVEVDAAGAYRLRIPVRRTGRLTVRAAHPASPQLARATAKAVRLDALPTRVSAGARGRQVRMLQRHLAFRGYVVGRRGTFDARTARAVLAFRKVSGLSRTSSADRTVMRRLAAGGGFFKVRFPGHGKHVEADLSRQVIALVRGRRVERIYHTSTGSSVTPTIRGSFRFERSQAGLNSLGMFWTRYFIRGYAIHGYHSVPTYPASHGCLRVPMADAKSIYDWIRLGDRIDVYP